MDKVRTVSDTKREFYQHHTRPINSIYRRFVEELLVEIHLLSVNNEFRYDPIFALGVVTAFERFMQGYRPEEDKPSIFNAICRAVGGDCDRYRQDASAILDRAKATDLTALMTRLSSGESFGGGDILLDTFAGVAGNSNFKYSRLFAIGTYTLLAEAQPGILKDDKERQEVLSKLSEALKLSPDKLQKDLDLYRGNLDKLDQLLVAIEETLEADRKKRRQKEESAASQETTPSES